MSGLSPSHASWTTAALLACLRAGVPVVFHDAGGQTVGWCFGPRRRETTLANLLREALDLPAGPDLLREWQRTQARREMLDTLRALGLHSLAAGATKLARGLDLGPARSRPAFVVGRGGTGRCDCSSQPNLAGKGLNLSEPENVGSHPGKPMSDLQESRRARY